MRSLPRLLLAACVCLGIAALLFAAGIGLELLPEDFGVEWNGLPLSEYELSDLAGGIVLFGLAGAVLAGIHLGRSDSRVGRRLARVLVVVGLVPLAVVAAIVLLIVALCSGGACS